MDVIAGVDGGPLAVASWLAQFWYEAHDLVHFGSVAIWVVFALVEEWLVDVLGFQGEFLFALLLVQTMHDNYGRKA